MQGAFGGLWIPPSHISYTADITSDWRAVFSIAQWNQPTLVDDGLYDNWCWPQAKTPNEPGFSLSSTDPWYRNSGRTPAWDYSAPYKAGVNGV